MGVRGHSPLPCTDSLEVCKNVGCSVEGQPLRTLVLLIEIGLERHLKIPQGLKHLAAKTN